MEWKDYYAALGVAPDADEQTIKRSYRKLARQYHPDINPGDKQAEERFKEIGEAYQVLNDKERRAKYDALRQQYQQWQQRGGTDRFDWSQWQNGAGQGVYSRTVSPEDLEELFGGASPFSDFFSSMFGQAEYTQAGEGHAPRPRRGHDIEALAEISLDEAFQGTTRVVQVGDRRIEAHIPAGIRDGTRIRLAGQGSPGMAGGPAGDLYLVVMVAPDERFVRDGDDLTTDLDVDAFTAATGGSARVRTIDGLVNLKVPARTQAGKTFRLRGKGMPRQGHADERGDLYARVRLVLPENLSDEDLETLRSLSHTRRVT